MADEEKDQEVVEEGADAAKGKKKILIIVGAVLIALLLIGGGIVIYFMTQSDDKAASMEAAETGVVLNADQLYPVGYGTEEEFEEGEEAIGALFPMETFVVNLPDVGFIRLQVQLEFLTRNVSRRFYAKQVPVRDAIITLLTLRTKDEISSAKGKELLKEEIKEIVNESLRRQDIKSVYFTQFVVQ